MTRVHRKILKSMVWNNSPVRLTISATTKITQQQHQWMNKKLLQHQNEGKLESSSFPITVRISVIVRKIWNTHWSSNFQVRLLLTEQSLLLPGKQLRTTYPRKHERIKIKISTLKNHIYAKNEKQQWIKWRSEFNNHNWTSLFILPYIKYYRVWSSTNFRAILDKLLQKHLSKKKY
jgi:hypothetical protein